MHKYAVDTRNPSGCPSHLGEREKEDDFKLILCMINTL